MDDVRPAPAGYVWCKSVNETIATIKNVNWNNNAMYDGTNYEPIELLDVDHDAGDYYCDGGDYIKVLDWMAENGHSYPIHIHSMNPVGVANMRCIIKRNGWKEVL